MSRTVTYAATLTLAAIFTLSVSACHMKPGGKGGGQAAVTVPESPYATIANGKVDVEGGVIQVAARAPGTVRDVYVQEGDSVTKGEILARQEDDAQRLAVQTAQAQVGQAKAAEQLTEVNIRTAQREYDRLAPLAPQNFVAKQKLDEARDAIDTAKATLDSQLAAVQTARAQLAQAQYNEELTIIRAPMDGKIIRRYANPGAGASTLNVSDMFDIEPAIPHIVRAEITESAIPDVHVGQEAEIVSENDPAKTYTGKVLRIAATFGARKLLSDGANEATDERVVEVVVSADQAPFLIGQRVLVKFMKPGKAAHATAATSSASAAPSGS
ncbi:HlyD family efflux transporter periplasmic adaptor subunit [Asticcacaulis sp. EMRT-3]|uniref:HlyD family secretion protein n=1 Tax=Asticcacaulis sp. EMRT-3 TaxID=3040349 RepID=UPI0024AE9EB0|nr:HlyD family efflux transporter periplasmic adaptor subunit [Asticcacaulis sp. EMRT-3]MDI7775222.1 efflux RND transporter periplasmic adaptor subunit [Asticcacaulis sp. EMRT-3]